MTDREFLQSLHITPEEIPTKVGNFYELQPMAPLQVEIIDGNAVMSIDSLNRLLDANANLNASAQHWCESAQANWYALRAWRFAAVAVLIFVGCLALAKATGVWQ